MKQPKQLEKCHKFEKIQRRSGDDIFWKIRPTNFEVSSVDLGIFYEVSVSKVYISTF